MVRASGVHLLRSIARHSTANGLFKGVSHPPVRSLFCKSSTTGVEDSLYGRGIFGAIRGIHSTASLRRDYYEVLGASKNVTQTELKHAFYALAKKHHPDMNKEDPEAEKKFQELNKAYEVLKDEQQREIYDQVGHDAYEQNKGQGGGDDFSFDDLFDRFRSGGQDVKASLELSFMEAVQGCTKTIKYQTTLPCVSCGGTGVPPGSKPETCKQCRGSGMAFMQHGIYTMQCNCTQCGGRGKIFKSHCRSCNGKRVVPGFKSVKLDISPGVDNDETLKVSRSGGADPEGYDPGDLYVIIKVKDDPVFRREGSNIHVDAVLSVSQAMLGGTIQVPTLTGNVVLKVRPGTQPGQKNVLKKKGIKSRGSFSFGDQFVHFNVTIPANLTPRQKELIEEFAKEECGEVDTLAAAASG